MVHHALHLTITSRFLDLVDAVFFCHGKWGPSRAATNWRHDGDESSTVRRVGDRVVDDIDKAQEMNGG